MTAGPSAPVGRLAGAAVAFLVLAGVAQTEPIRVCPANPHYFMRDGRPFVLVTSDHHYGGVIDADFDFVRYLDCLGAAGLNLTRIYPGAMFEPPDKWIKGNPLGPRPGRQILPWARSDVVGAHPSLAEPGQASRKFDLDRWNPVYFDRLKAFVELAARKGIVVEIAFFNGMYADSWPLMALNAVNNVQGVGRYEARDCGLFTSANTRNQDVVRYQTAYVAKIARELNAYDNVIYDLCDEPILEGRPDGTVVTLPGSMVRPWLHTMKDAFLVAEAKLPKKHVLGQTVQSLSPDLSAEPWCAWLPTEYLKPALAALERNYAIRKPLVNVESDYYGLASIAPYTVDDVRVEGWRFLVGGGAGTVNLNGEYHRGQEAAGGDTQQRIVPQRKVLKDFLDGFDLAAMVRFAGLTGVPTGALASALAEPGKQYAVYLFHATEERSAHLRVAPGSYREGLTLKAVPAGRYHLSWIDPANGAVRSAETIDWKGGDLHLTTPVYCIDIALRMRRAHRSDPLAFPIQ